MPREKIKFALRIMPETQQLVKDYYPLDNCQNQSEFIEKAIRFYVSYIASKDATEFLAPILISALQSTIKNAENHLSRLQFKTAVELNMMKKFLLDIAVEDVLAFEKGLFEFLDTKYPEIPAFIRDNKQNQGGG